MTEKIKYVNKINPEEMVTVYSGTTLQNYRSCAYETSKGILFDKKKEPKHDFKTLFFVPAFEGAARYTLEIAKKLRHTPLIVDGWVKRNRRLDYELPEEEPFYIGRIYLPKPGVDWRKINPHDPKSLEGSFMEINPKKLLRHTKLINFVNLSHLE